MEDNLLKKQKIRHRIQYAQRCLTIFMLLCVAYLIWYHLDSFQVKQKNKKLQEIAWQIYENVEQDGTKRKEALEREVSTRETAEKETLVASTKIHEKTQTEIYPITTGLESLYEINCDLKGWISIPGTTLSYPIVQGENNDYYLNHDFYGQPDRHGTIFADCEADFGKEKNIVLYGHNMRDNSMFGSLKEYGEESYYKEHPSFFIYLPEEVWECEILAVLRNDIFSRAEEPFQYYDYKHIDSEEMFETYYQGIKERSLYEIEVEAQYTDELITLCTCDYGSLDQRLLVIGKKKYIFTKNDQ